MGVELYNKVLGIIGAGQIGSHLTKMAQGIGMSVVAFDPYLAPERAERMGVTMLDLEELFRQADIISVHTPLTPETRGIINAQAIAKMKPGVLIVNCARGGIINEQDLCEALKTKRVAAAAFDVFEEEPVKPDNPLLALDNFICTPHIGAQTTEAQENVAIGIAEQMSTTSPREWPRAPSIFRRSLRNYCLACNPFSRWPRSSVRFKLNSFKEESSESRWSTAGRSPRSPLRP